MQNFETSAVEARALGDCPHDGESIGTVAVHALRLDAALAVAVEGVLDADELHRYAQLRSSPDQERYIASRMLAKAVVGDAISLHPSEVRISATAGQRPRALEVPHCHLSISHTRGLVTVACATGQEVGVDAEHREDGFDAVALAQRFFAPSERRALAQLAPERRTEAFFRLWTGKEALMKASGIAFDQALRVDLHPLLSAPQRATSGSWSVRALPTFGGAALAVAAAGEDWRPALTIWSAEDLAGRWRLAAQRR